MIGYALDVVDGTANAVATIMSAPTSSSSDSSSSPSSPSGPSLTIAGHRFGTKALAIGAAAVGAIAVWGGSD